MLALDDKARRDLVEAVRKARHPEKTLLDYRREDFDLGSSWTVIDAALSEVKRGRGVALIRGLPRESLDEKDFELLTWAIGLHAGVGRPQGKASHYIVDHEEPSQKRLLFRLWLAPPDSDRLPESWRVLYQAVEPGTVRGGIIGQNYNDSCKAFERRQAKALGMSVAT